MRFWQTISRAMRAFRALVISIITLVLIGAEPAYSQSNSISSQDLDVQLKYAGAAMPLIIVGPAPDKAKRTITFAWQEGCKPCQEIFQAKIWPIATNSRQRKATLIVISQYETDPIKKKQLATVLCKGSSDYEMAAMRHLLTGRSIAELMRNPLPHQKSRPAPICKEERKIADMLEKLSESMKKRLEGRKLPVIGVNGKELSDLSQLN